LIGCEILAENIGNTYLRVVDCRFDLMHPIAGRTSYEQGHIPGAVFVDLNIDLAAPVQSGTGRHPLPDADELARTFGRLGIGQDTQVVVYDDCSGALAARTWWLLRWLGHEDVALLEGGIARWKSLRLPVEEGAVAHAQSVFTAEPRTALVVETPDIAEAVKANGVMRLVDARDAARFRGESEPIDAVAGHVPGALNLPFGECLNPDGTWKTPADIERLWFNVLGKHRDSPCCVMCGSGVTACHLIISALVAGLPEPRLYAGSWSEWIADPARPVATEASQGDEFGASGAESA
jgi:thiosulfate/3-mercaptopyruvate sulfurtransferase